MAFGIFGEPWFLITMYVILGTISFVLSWSCNGYQKMFWLKRFGLALLAFIVGPLYVMYFAIFKAYRCDKKGFLE